MSSLLVVHTAMHNLTVCFVSLIVITQVFPSMTYFQFFLCPDGRMIIYHAWISIFPRWSNHSRIWSTFCMLYRRHFLTMIEYYLHHDHAPHHLQGFGNWTWLNPSMPQAMYYHEKASKVGTPEWPLWPQSL